MGFLDDIGGSLSVINPIAMIANAATGPGTALLNARETSRQNDRMEQNHWEDMRLQREDNNTAVQRRAKDMQAAGINPLLAAGDGANSVNGSSPSMVAPQITAPDILPALQFAETVKNNASQRSLTEAQKRLTEAQKRGVDITNNQEENSATSALSEWWKGLINKDKSKESFNSLKDKFNKWTPKTKKDWENERQKTWNQKQLTIPKGN